MVMGAPTSCRRFARILRAPFPTFLMKARQDAWEPQARMPALQS